MPKRYYLAYGSNLNVRQMRVRCPNAKVIGFAEIKDYRLLFKGSQTGSYLTIEPAKGKAVPVGVWEVSESDEKDLDRYEGFPAFYYKKELTLPIEYIGTHKIFSRPCFVYIMHEDRPFGIPSKPYMRVCLEGYRDFDFDRDILLRACYESEVNYENQLYS